MSVTRRELKPFASFGDAVADAERLLAGGYDRAGNWSLGQCCGHLSNWLTYQLDGFPPLPLWLRPIFWAARTTVATGMLRKVNRAGVMPVGSATAPTSVPPPDAGDAAGVADYKRAIDRWTAHTGPFVPSPLFGHQSRDDWHRLHLVHAAHHLSFLVPK